MVQRAREIIINYTRLYSETHNQTHQKKHARVRPEKFFDFGVKVVVL